VVRLEQQGRFSIQERIVCYSLVGIVHAHRLARQLPPVRIEIVSAQSKMTKYGIDKAQVKTYDQRKRKAIEIVEPMVQVLSLSF